MFYAPIIPMVLVNGSKGIGTGFSTEILSYNPLDIICYLKRRIEPATQQQQQQSSNVLQFIPYYEGFQGIITPISKDKFLIKGIYSKIGIDKIIVTELPVGYWTEDFKCLLDTLREPEVDKDGKKKPAIIKDFDDNSSDTTIIFVITFTKGMLEELEAMTIENGCNGLEKVLKLYSTVSTTNMHLFDEKDKLKKYNTVEEIIDNYYKVRLELYQERKNYLITELQKEMAILINKARYIKENLDGTIDLRKKKKDNICNMLREKKYDIIEDDEDYKYLIKMPMDSVTEENVTKLFKERDNKQFILDNIYTISIQKMWLQDLEILEKMYIEYKNERTNLNSGKKEKNCKSKSKNTKKTSQSTKMNLIIEEEHEEED
jgi:DNA topoisomerase-2